MTDRAADPTGRRRLLVRSLMARRGQSDRLVVHAAERSEAAGSASGSEQSERHASHAGEGSQPADGASGREHGDRHASHAGEERTLRYGDRELELHLRPGERERLDALLDDYPVFKIDAPATRKAREGEVYVAAVADPKHLADFIEDCCRRVYGLPEGFVLRTE